MENKRYKLGVIDLYSVAKNETEIESTPVFFVTLRDMVDKEKLSAALRKALTYYPLFATTLEYKGEYALVSQDGELPIIESSFEDRLKYFGKETGGYLYRFCIWEREIAFEWSRILTDEFGARDFLLAVLYAYFGESIKEPDDKAVDIFLEVLTEKSAGAAVSRGATSDETPKEKEKKDYSQVKNPHTPTRKNPNEATLYTISVNMNELRASSSRDDASCGSVIIPIFSNVLHRRAGDGDVSVTADVIFDCRKPGLDSMHNFTVSKILAYSNIFSKTDVKRLMEVYEKMLSSAKDGVKDEAERTINAVKPLVNLRPRFLADFASLVVSKAVKRERSNFAFLNLGKIELTERVGRGIERIKICAIPDSADTGISVLEHSDKLIMTITENYVDEKIISDFVSISKMLGINFKIEKSEAFTQSRLKLK